MSKIELSIAKLKAFNNATKQASRDKCLNDGIGNNGGWKRDTSVDDEYAFDEISPYGLKALAKVCREGFKHGRGNWREHPQPEGVVLNHALAHLNKYMQNDRSEDHLAKVAWGMFALIHYRESKAK